MTIKEIAKAANVSIGTVDRVLHNRGRVSDETRQTVLKIIEKSGYKKNLFASNLANSKKQFNLMVLMPKRHQDSGYWSLVKNGLDSAASELASFNTNVYFEYFDRFSENSFQQAYNNTAASNSDGVFMAPVMSHIAAHCLKSNPLSMPFSCFDSNINASSQLSFIGQNSFQGGVLGGRLMHLLIPTGGTIAVTRLQPEGCHINERIAGFKSYLKPYPTFSIKEYVLNDNDGTMNICHICKQIETNCPELKGIFVTNAATHYFANYFKDSPVRIVGFDLVPKNREGVADGTIDFIISQSPEMQGYKGLITLHKSIILGESCSKADLVPLNIITKENLDFCQNI
jgi:LacI family transcriptional regulator